MLRGLKTRATRIILDSGAKTPIDAKVVRTAREQPTLLAVAPNASPARLRRLKNAGVQILELDLQNLRLVFEALAGEGFHKILVEGGGEVHASVLREAGLADEACIFIAPKIVGGRGAKTPVEGEGLSTMAEALCLSKLSVERFGDDVMIRGRFKS
jgi:diaminohydroxyphosphoribosylaminopyrimidine deaminase/5-amino-6-(5-phosphoribosylamino)uracil reductase